MRIQGLRVKLPEVFWNYAFEFFIYWVYLVQILKCALYDTITIFKHGISISQQRYQTIYLFAKLR